MTSLCHLSFLLYWFKAVDGEIFSDVTYPESPKMITFKSTFFLEVILLQLKEGKEQMFRPGCISNTPPRHNISLKYINLYSMHVQVGNNWTNQLWVPHICHVISTLLTESRGTHHSSFVLTHYRKSLTGGLMPLYCKSNSRTTGSIFDSVTEHFYSKNQTIWTSELTTASEIYV